MSNRALITDQNNENEQENYSDQIHKFKKSDKTPGIA